MKSTALRSLRRALGLARAVGFGGGEPVEAVGAALGEALVDALGERLGGVTEQSGERLGVGEEVEHGGVDALAALYLLELELVAPGDEGTPDELIGGDDDEDHGAEAVGDGEAVAGVGGGLEVGTESGEAEGAGADVEHLAGDEGEPGASDAHDGVPDQTDGGVGQLELQEALDAGEAVDDGGFDELLGDALEGGVKAKREVPDRTGENKDDRAHLDAELAGGEEGDHGEHDGGEEAEDGDRLEDVEDRDHEQLGAAVVGGDVAVADGEEQAEQVGEADADDGVEGVEGKRAGVEGDDGLGFEAAGPEHADADDGVEDGEADAGDAEVEDEGPGALDRLGAGEDLAAGGCWRSSRGRCSRVDLRGVVDVGVFVELGGLDKAAAGGVEVEEFGVAAPVDGGFELAQGLFFAELLVEHVVEELFGDSAVALGVDGADDLAQEQDVFDGGFAEELFLAEDLGVGVGSAGGGDGGVALVDGEEAEELGGIDDGKQVVDLEGEVVGETVDVVLTVVVEEELEQAGDAAGTGVGEHLVVHLALVADGASGGGGGQRGGLGVGLGEDLVDVVDELGEGGGFAVARVGEADLEVGADVAGVAAEDDDAVGEQDGFFDVVGDDEDGLGGDGLFLPELEEFGAEVLGGENVEGAEGLVHEENFGLDHESAGEADALAHAAGELLGVGGLKAVEADGCRGY